MRLVSGPDIRRVLTQGRRSRHATVDVFWMASDQPHARMGLVVPRLRQSAPARNRLRRRLKELWRREVAVNLPTCDVVIRTNRGTYQAGFGALRNDLLAWRASLSPDG